VKVWVAKKIQSHAAFAKNWVGLPR